jgi:spermidine/putrescine transport system permease protein
LPVLIYGKLFSGLSPEINAIAAIVLVLTISIGVAGERLFGRERET